MPAKLLFKGSTKPYKPIRKHDCQRESIWVRRDGEYKRACNVCGKRLRSRHG